MEMVGYYKEKSRRSVIVEMLDAVNPPVGRTLMREREIRKLTNNVHFEVYYIAIYS